MAVISPFFFRRAVSPEPHPSQSFKVPQLSILIPPFPHHKLKLAQEKGESDMVKKGFQTIGESIMLK